MKYVILLSVSGFTFTQYISTQRQIRFRLSVKDLRKESQNAKIILSTYKMSIDYHVVKIYDYQQSMY